MPQLQNSWTWLSETIVSIRFFSTAYYSDEQVKLGILHVYGKGGKQFPRKYFTKEVIQKHFSLEKFHQKDSPTAYKKSSFNKYHDS